MTRRHTLAACFVLISLASGPSAQAQAPSSGTNGRALPTSALVGTWQGTVTVATNILRIGLLVTQSDAGSLNATLVIIDQDGARIPVQQATLSGKAVHLDVTGIKASYDGVLDAANAEITGTLTQGMPISLNFRRVDKLDAPPTFGEKESADIRAVVNEYLRAFTAKDFEAFRAVFQPPYMMWAIGGSPNMLTSLDDIVNRYRMLRDSLDATDYAVSKAAGMTITPLSTTAALVDIHWRRDKKDGTLFNEGGGSWRCSRRRRAGRSAGILAVSSVNTGRSAQIGYSYRRATTGFTRVARHAGTYPATAAARPSVATAMTMVVGSLPVMPYS